MKTIIIIAAIAAILIAAWFIVGTYFYNIALGRNEKSFLKGDPNLPRFEPPPGVTDSWAGMEEWYAAVPRTDVSLTSFDGLRLAGVEIPAPSPSDKWVLLVHGYTSNKEAMLDRARYFHDAGYNCLLVDCRGHGKSEGKSISMGWLDRLDVADWIRNLVQKHPDARIALHGISMGGATVMMTTGEALPPNVKAIVEDCGYTSVWDIFTYQLRQLFRLPPFPVMYAANNVVELRDKYNMRTASAVNQLAKTELPVFFIHGDTDTFVPYAMLDQVYNAKTAGVKEKWTVPGAGHGMAMFMDPDLYMDKVSHFIDRYM
jgi:fermentation-respiration switch protein FrsA (DUF1100 family)